GMTKGRALLLGIPAAVVVACLAGSYLTQGAMGNLAFLKRGGAGGPKGGVGPRARGEAGAAAPPAGGAGGGEEAGRAREAGAHARGNGWPTTRWTRRSRWRCARRRWSGAR